MEFINFTIENTDALPLGVSIMVVGVIFFYMPISKHIKSLRVNHLEAADIFKSQGHEKSADKIKGLHQAANNKLPFYGKLFIVLGAVITSYGVYHAL
ncbi:hypothetical protein MNBD_GAMMA15-1275 [hydrothermal vent metagenome]|uniref:DUF3899 domain-containing protein n=1 Tax=hydrothermal vent metagenome TaxID=652676 RepID=A0A3B0ZDU7_9ZZZZ